MFTLSYVPGSVTSELSGAVQFVFREEGFDGAWCAEPQALSLAGSLSQFGGGKFDAGNVHMHNSGGNFGADPGGCLLGCGSGAAGAVADSEGGQSGNFVWFLPGEEIPERVGSQQQEQFGLREFWLQASQGVDGPGGSRSAEFAAVYEEFRAAGNGQLDHVGSGMTIGGSLVGFVG